MEFAIKWMYSVDASLSMPYQDNLISLMSTEELEENKALFDGAHVLYEDDNYIVVTAD